MAPRLSGVQLEAVHLFRRLLRAAKSKDGGAGSTTELVRREFRQKVLVGTAVRLSVLSLTFCNRGGFTV